MRSGPPTDPPAVHASALGAPPLQQAPGRFLLAEGAFVEPEFHEERQRAPHDGTRAHLEQLATYGTPGRDPRGRVVSVAYLALAPDLPLPSAGSDAAAARWMPVDDLAGKLAFDHPAILADAVERARAKLEYTPLAAAFCADPFTIAELRNVYEVVWGVELDPRNFHRKVTTTRGFVVPADGTTTRDGGRPAQLYSAGPADVLRPPLMRTGVTGADR